MVEPTWLRVQGLPEKLPLAAPLEKLTVPAGNDFVPLSVSETTTVQVVEPLIGVEDGEQPVTLVEVERAVMLKALLVAPIRPVLVAVSV